MLSGVIKIVDAAVECATPVIVLADPAVDEHVIAPTEGTRGLHRLEIHGRSLSYREKG